MNAAMIILTVLVAVVRTQSGLQSSCDLDVSVFERRNLIGNGILNRLGLERVPNIQPMVPTPEQESNLMAVQELQVMKGKDRVMCTKRDAFATLKQANFQTTARALHDHQPFDDTTVYNYYHLLGKGRDKRAKSSLPFIPPSIYQFTFPVNLTYDGRSYMSSELYLLRKVLSQGRTFLTNTETIQLVYVYKVWYLRKGGGPVQVTKREIISTKVVDAVDGYMSFNTTDAVNKWIEHNNRLFGEITFEVVIKPPVLISTGLPLFPVIEFDVYNNYTSQFVLNFLKPENIPNASRATRKKRQLATIPRLDADFCFSHPNETNCCIRDLTIDFAKDLGYTWIGSPKSYQPNYCTGLCPALWPTASQSTDFLRIFKERNPTFAVSPCCSPEELEPLSVLVNTGKGPVIQQLPDMVIKSCICR